MRKREAVTAGELDRRITLLVRMNGADPDYGTREVTWAKLTDVWASVQEIVPSRADRLAPGVTISRRPATVKIRWRSDITAENNRVRIEGVEMRIVGGPAMIGRRRDLEMMVEAISTEGQAP